MKRKLGSRQLAAAQARFLAAAKAVLAEIGARPDDARPWLPDHFTLETRAGTARLAPYACGSQAGGWLYVGFEDVPRACTLLNPDRRFGWPTRLNPFSGKYNLDSELFGVDDPEVVRREICQHLAPLLITTSKELRP